MVSTGKVINGIESNDIFNITEDKTEGFCDSSGNPVLTYDYVEILRDLNSRKKLSRPVIIAQRGGQENILSCNSDIYAAGGARGGSKSFSALLECLKDVDDPHFEALILRKEKPDLINLIKDSRTVFKDFGYYVSSDKDMVWNLSSGGHIRFSYHGGALVDFKMRFQGQQFSLIVVDECSHCEWEKILYLMTCNRNAWGIRNRMMLTCNPDNTSFLRKLIDYWVSNSETIYPDGQTHPELNGYIIPHRDSVPRYAFFSGENLNDIVWGDSRDEVYEKCKDRIDSIWDPAWNRFGTPKDLFILSVTFVEAKLADNLKLMESDPTYLKNLANQSDDQIARDLKGNWDYENISEDYIAASEMEEFFRRPPDYGDNVLRVGIDPSWDGGDREVLWLVRGNCIIDVDSVSLNSKDNVAYVKNKIQEWGVREENICYDGNGVGKLFSGYFRKSIAFNNQEGPYGATERDLEMAKRDYDTLKSQCAYNLADAIKYGELTISQNILSRRFSGKGYDNMPLKDILLQERKFFNVDEAKRDRGKGKCLSSKPDIKKWLHRSPDFTEALVYSRIFWVKKTQQRRVLPRGYTRYVRY